MQANEHRGAGSSRGPSLFLCAGDASGDQHAAEMVRCLHRRRPELQVDALGGPALAETEARLLLSLAADPIMGFKRVAAALGRFMRLLSACDRHLAEHRPDAVVLVDYPGFNVHLAALARRRGLRTIYYVCPQYWAWAPWRVRRFSKVVDEALAIFPFEVDYFAAHGLEVHHVGHPSADRIERHPEPEDPGAPWRVALLPGSRSAEVRHHWDWLLGTARRLRERSSHPVRFVSTHFKEATRQRLREQAVAAGVEVEVEQRPLGELLVGARLALVGSGTATLECALAGVPSCVVYRVDRLSLWLSGHLMTSPYIAQPNLLSGRELFPELLRAEDAVEELAAAGQALLEDGAPRERCLEGLQMLRRRHLRPGTAERAAERILAHLPEA